MSIFFLIKKSRFLFFLICAYGLPLIANETLIKNKLNESKVLPGLYIEGYGGIVFGLDKIQNLTLKNCYDVPGLKCSFSKSGKMISPNFSGGIKFGCWCQNSVHHFYNHLGLYLDLNYHYLKYDHRIQSTELRYLDQSVNPSLGPAFARTTVHLMTKGPTITASLLFALRANFFKTEHNHLGWFQPYVAIGPGMDWIQQKSYLKIYPHATSDNSELSVTLLNPRLLSSKHSDNNFFPCLTTDLGFVFYLTRTIALDYFFRYNYLTTHFSYHVYRWKQKECYNLFYNHLGFVYSF